MKAFSWVAETLFFVSIIAGFGCNLHPEVEKSSLEKIMDGSSRFASAKPKHPDESKARSSEVANSQHPMAIVITCSDSRVSPELIFDEGIGDLFVIRTAGNIISNIEMGSVEYAVEHLKVPLVIVMGHERCGTVQAMVGQEKPHGHISCIIDSLRNEKEIQAIALNDPNRLEDCILANVRHGVNVLRTQSDLLSEKIKTSQLKIIGTRYDLDDRKVTVLNY